MKHLIFMGDSGPDVEKLRKALADALGADAALFPALKKTSGPVDEAFDAAIRRWQGGVGIIADGIVGPYGQNLLGLTAPAPMAFTPPLNVGNVSQLFPATKSANIARYLPYVMAALGSAGIADQAMVLGALGTIRAETEGFVPISEFQSRFNTPPQGPAFSLYDHRGDIGNKAAGDGARFRGRGFVQLTGRSNYRTYGQRIDYPLENDPDRANAPEVAAVLLAQFLADKATKFRAALAAGDLRAARRLVNGGSHGLVSFSDVFERAEDIWGPVAPTITAAGKAGAAKPRKAPKATKATAAPVRAMRTRKDAADLRDRAFQPAAFSLPEEHPPQIHVGRFLPAYSAAGLVLDQGSEGACTGFGLACVINYMRWVRAQNPAKMESVSPRMLYTLARRHDEYDGENYDGSSCRGAIKGWFNNGVCLETDWPYTPDNTQAAKYGFAERAAQNTLGVYYRIDTKSITDLQAAIAQHAAIYVSAFTHDGWGNVASKPITAKAAKTTKGKKTSTATVSHATLPEIIFDGRPSQSGGHAFAIVGFNTRGFIVQNSWGPDWGQGGFAVLSYLDWLANGMDAWVVAMGVPGVVAGRLAVVQGPDGGSAGIGSDRSKWWDQGLAYQHSVVLGNDGRVSRYLTEDEQPRKLQKQVYALPDAWFRSQKSATKRLVLYVHGGLNSEEAAIKRVSAMGRFFIGNGCYPLFLVWKTGVLESLGGILADAFRRQPAAAAGAGEWFTEKTDLLVEKSIGRPLARPIWSEMKENACLAYAPRRGGDLLLDALQALAGTWGNKFELHLIGHSAGAIALGHLLGALQKRATAGQDGGLNARVVSTHLYAPACSVAFANTHYASNEEVMKRLHLDVLADTVERDDTVASVYRKSLLYLVANALETDLHTPILGLARVFEPNDAGWDGSSDTNETLATWRAAAANVQLAERTTQVTSSAITTAIGADQKPVQQPAAHGSFDNDITVLTRTLERITGGPLSMPIDDLRGY
ncbi:C1 family peptidase [Variovorax sp. HJSM1_2]|uniref:C1 family peptidase n=1 Tax=Variovorax sp. HJSM1_2 TaxID=3366263 RepID=UPI003BDBB8A2